MSEATPPQFVERRAESRYITLQDVKTAITMSLMEHEVRERETMRRKSMPLRQRKTSGWLLRNVLLKME